ncbi:hypothetical protein [Sphingobacterium hungaricum]|uniref:Uncharacterized protein n=1 Tax=Sphingobacterium hungaricum TaxID=2082723 RepID=A0A928UWH7_9SPHI|nr:hypothetical protein [Sphingobacterium hungaricum]MBE8714520.1 hypothetical protein [Sphingobacterium hungaricum]
MKRELHPNNPLFHYVSPVMEVIILEFEQGIATTSAVVKVESENNQAQESWEVKQENKGIQW